jgi:hypothetical protein
VADVKFELKAVPQFWKAYSQLGPEQKKAAKQAFKVFKKNPFDPSLRPHKIHRLTAIYRKPVMSVVLDNDLRSVFIVQGNQIISLDIGTHDIYG